MKFRTEKDLLGEKKIPASAYYGAQTARALENFQLTGVRMNYQPVFIEAFAFVKKAAALANKECGIINPVIANVIASACDRIIAGQYHEYCCTDLLQGGAGTSVNMNMNEVIANVALELLGYPLGTYDVVHPNNHVNCSQSTNDTYPTAIGLTLYKKTGEFMAELERLQQSCLQKAQEFAHVIKMGRTQLQDAVPMQLGQEFHAFASTIGNCITSLTNAQSQFCDINLGGTAIGTAINTPQRYPAIVTEVLSQLTGVPLRQSNDFINASSEMGDYQQLSGTLKRTAVTISKICNDLRLLSSGPRCGLHEINLPEVQPGSSIMPGKVNPVIPEVVSQAAFFVCGADTTVTMAAEAGQLELNVMEPVIAFSLFSALDVMTGAVRTLREKCVDGITANEEVCRHYVMNSIGIVTALNPYLGYETASGIAREAQRTGKSVYQVTVTDHKFLTDSQWQKIFNDENMVHPRIRHDIVRKKVAQ